MPSRPARQSPASPQAAARPPESPRRPSPPDAGAGRRVPKEKLTQVQAFRIPSTASTRPPGCVAWRRCRALHRPAARLRRHRSGTPPRPSPTPSPGRPAPPPPPRPHRQRASPAPLAPCACNPRHSPSGGLRDEAAAGTVAELLACFEAGAGVPRRRPRSRAAAGDAPEAERQHDRPGAQAGLPRTRQPDGQLGRVGPPAAR